MVGSQSRKLNRRTFVAGGVVAGVGTTAFVGLSSSWPARFLRDRLSEFGREVPFAPHKPTPASWDDNAITIAWLGHATVLINLYGVRIITDPLLFPRIGIDMGVGSFGPLRLVNCALMPDELPELDLVLVSHAHFDHLDTPSLAAVRGRPSAVMAKATSDLLPRSYYSSVQELGWNESATVSTPRGEVHVRSIEVNHWGARLQRDTYRGYTGLRARAGGTEALDRWRHRRHAALPRSSSAWSVRGRHHADWRVQPMDSLSLHAGAGGCDGGCGRCATIRPGASSVVSVEPRTRHRAHRTSAACAGGRARPLGAA